MPSEMGPQGAFLNVVLFLGLFVGGVLSYDRPPRGKNIFVPLAKGQDGYSPQQVHISLVGPDKMRISWITQKSTPAVVNYGTSPTALNASSNGTTTSYHYLKLYKSGQIHDAVIGPLKPNTVYHYKCGGPNSAHKASFKTPPAQFPIKFAVSGDLGQTAWTKSTLDHISKSNYDVLLLPGDLSYADFIQIKWDSFGRLVEPLASQRPWMVTNGNHDVEKIPAVHNNAFTAYNARWRMPYEQSGSGSNLYYSFNVAGVHVIMLGSYADFGPGSDQYRWLQGDLAKIDRKATPWVVASLHAPWYNSNKAHQGEIESVKMKESMEELLYKARVDVIFAGHVHAYERFDRVYKGKGDPCGPIYITIGDGVNHEGLATKYIDPKPPTSLFREASFGHGQLDVVNATNAVWSWHRNADKDADQADKVALTSLSSNPSCKKMKAF